MTMSSYNGDQFEAIMLVRRYLEGRTVPQREALERRIQPYLRFRADVARFQERYFSAICQKKCFSSRTSACCGREGIATFFADVVVNVFLSAEEEVEVLLETLHKDRGGPKCVYLAPTGCLWRLKPIVCEMFLCEDAKKRVLGRNDTPRVQWEELGQREKAYTWPSKPVLFDEIEELFIRAGYDSRLMYFHHSPGLLRVKARSLKKTPKAPA